MSLVDLGKRLLHASRSGDVEEVRVLMANGAPFTTDWLGTSPLHYAANHGHIPTAEVLLRAGISRDARTKVDRTPLHIACQEGHAEIAELLLKHGADADAKDMLKMSPLHWAVERGHDDCVHALLKHGADPNHEDKFDRTALQIALATQNMEVAQSLELVTATKPTERISEYIGVDDITEAVDVINEVEAETENTITVSASSLQKTGARFRIKNKMNPSTTVKSSRQPSSTAVLATLAALAEATAPLNTTSTSSSVSSASSGLSTTDTLNWLQTHGITMVTDDGALVNSAMEGGDTLTLTEAGKLALNFVKQKVSRKEIKKENTVIDEQDVENILDPSIITIVNAASDVHDQHVFMADDDVDARYEDMGEPLHKQIKLEPEEIALNDEIDNYEVSEDIPDDTTSAEDLKNRLKTITQKAKEYKTQLKEKQKEAEVYKNQLIQVRKSTRKIIKKVIRDIE